ncbi:MAG: hypothetical protein HY791_30645 [Deltaproteobacteria bacterium]|nr:hypothetical protein [Deltaproteobacteria bacterium]
MRTDLGRFMEGYILETTLLIKAVYDLGTGQGKDVAAWVDGRELVFVRGEEGKGPGFLRMLPQANAVVVSFPRGHEISDPLSRMKGVAGSRTRVTVRSISELDPYLRRVVAAAYALGP